MGERFYLLKRSRRRGLMFVLIFLGQAIAQIPGIAQSSQTAAFN